MDDSLAKLWGSVFAKKAHLSGPFRLWEDYDGAWKYVITDGAGGIIGPGFVVYDYDGGDFDRRMWAVDAISDAVIDEQRQSVIRSDHGR